MSVGPIEAFMTADHVRLDALLAAADAGDHVELRPFEELRAELLRHIAMEEKVLLRFAREKLGEPLPLAARLRADHGRIAKIFVPTPTAATCEELRRVLAEHNPIEEGARGLYATCDDLAGDEAPALVEKLRAQPRPPLAPHYDGPAHDR